MFDLITGKATHIPSTPAVPILISTAAQMTILGLVLALPVLFFTDRLPEASTVMAFVAPAPPPPSPPPPPPAPAAAAALARRPVPTTGTAAPVVAPNAILPESPALDTGEDGVLGGVPGGIPGGVVGGFVTDFAVPPPPPLPPPPAPRTPVRVGGEIKQPALLHRVEPVYPPLAVAASLEGTVILEAIVDEDGRVTNVRVLRSMGVLDRAAIDAVRQWRYAPLLLNGRPSPFELTVVLSFRLTR